MQFSLSVKTSETFVKISAVGTSSKKCQPVLSNWNENAIIRSPWFYRNYIVLLVVNYLIFRRACLLIQVPIVHY